MGIYDRRYYRDERSGSGWKPGAGGSFRRGMSAWSVNTWIIVVNVAIHLLANTVMHQLYAWGSLSTYTAFQRLEVWRLVTFQFLHSPDTIMHLAFNMFGLYIFGGIVESTLGGKRYLAFYLTCGIAGGVMFVLLNLLGIAVGHPIPGLLYMDTNSQLIGASAGVFGVIMACAYIMPDSIVQMIFPPISMKMRTFAYGYVVFVALNLILGGHNAGGDAAHMGGAIAGFYFIRHPHLLRDFFDVFGDSRPNEKQPKGRKDRQNIDRKHGVADAMHQQRLKENARIDAILDKINREGVGSLTAAEKKILAQDTERRRKAGEL